MRPHDSMLPAGQSSGRQDADRGIDDAVCGGMAMTTRIASAGLRPDAQHLGPGMKCGPLTAPLRRRARMEPNGGPMQDFP